MKDIFDLLGRLFLAFIFLYEAYDSIYYYGSTKKIMTEYGITWRQDLLLVGAISLLVLGGIMILVGYRASLGAIFILMYWIPVTFLVHSFWNDAPDVRRENALFFMKNIAITGGLMMVFGNGVGKFSLKRLFARVN